MFRVEASKVYLFIEFTAIAISGLTLAPAMFLIRRANSQSGHEAKAVDGILSE